MQLCEKAEMGLYSNIQYNLAYKSKELEKEIKTNSLGWQKNLYISKQKRRMTRSSAHNSKRNK